MTTYKYFVLLANMRTGSNLFEDNIQQYRDFSCHGELFNPHFIGFPNTAEKFGVSLSERELKPQKLLNRMVSQEKDTLPGFRLFSDHDHRMLTHCLADERCAKVVLTRNPLDSFVSHAIAKSTDQWKLTDVSKRKVAKVRFDFQEFKTYLAKLNNYLRHIRSTLQKNGQAAYYLEFDDLNDVDVFNGLAQYLGSDEKLSQLDANIVRQNPEGLRDKVENYDEMIDQIQKIDLLGAQTVPQQTQIRNPAPKNLVAGTDVPFLYIPLRKDDFPEVTDWIAAHQKSQSAVQTNLNQKQLGTWLNDAPARKSFTILRHPLERAYEAFYDHIFCSGEKLFPWIRTTLETHYDLKLPDKKMTEQPNRQALKTNGYSVEAHQQAFLCFLKFLKGNLQGQTRARIDQSWASQSSVLLGYCQLVFPDEIIRDHDLASALHRIEDDLDLPHHPIKSAARDDFCYSLDEIHTGQMENLCATIYAQDYQMFGFRRWK